MVRVKTKEEQLEEQLEAKKRMKETIQRIRTDLDINEQVEEDSCIEGCRCCCCDQSNFGCFNCGCPYCDFCMGWHDEEE